MATLVNSESSEPPLGFRLRGVIETVCMELHKRWLNFNCRNGIESLCTKLHNTGFRIRNVNQILCMELDNNGYNNGYNCRGVIRDVMETFFHAVTQYGFKIRNVIETFFHAVIQKII